MRPQSEAAREKVEAAGIEPAKDSQAAANRSADPVGDDSCAEAPAHELANPSLQAEASPGGRSPRSFAAGTIRTRLQPGGRWLLVPL
jgi:hypothetical protein